MTLPCQIDPDHCWGHHPGSTDCCEFRPRSCDALEVSLAMNEPVRDCENRMDADCRENPCNPCDIYEDEEALR